MDKHLLLTISADISVFYGLRFVSNFFDLKDTMRFTLFYTMSPGPLETTMGRDKDLYLQQKKRAERELDKGKKAMENARDMLCRRGFTCDAQAMRLQGSRFSKAMDIIKEAEEGLYDAVVLGRRGMSWFEAALCDNISEQMLKETFRIPIWFCRRPERDRKNVLLCVDGSEQSKRIADHVGFMMAKEDRHRITLLNVELSKDESVDCDRIFDEAETELVSNGVPKDRIKRLVLRGSSVGKTVLKEAQDSRYAVVAMGRTGSGQGGLLRLFMGSSSTELFKELSGAVLWLSY